VASPVTHAPPGAAGFPAAETQERKDVRNTIRALAVGITRGFLAASGIALAGLVITVITIRIRREDLAGTAEPALGQPAGAELALDQARS
jgi:hypothetical protein